jgi:hypothetical protein
MLKLNKDTFVALPFFEVRGLDHLAERPPLFFHTGPGLILKIMLKLDLDM